MIEKSTFLSAGWKSCNWTPRSGIVCGVQRDSEDLAAVGFADQGDATFGPVVRHREVAVPEHLANLSCRNPVLSQMLLVVVVPLEVVNLGRLASSLTLCMMLYDTVIQ